MSELLDTDGENQAVRCFLGMYQCGGNPSVKLMKIHLEHSGFDGCWPEWVNQSDAGTSGHLTKSGAQDWIRHLFSLEPKVDRIAALEKQNAELLSAIQSAYGFLWHVNIGVDAPPEVAPPTLTPEKASYKARHILRDLLTSQQRGNGINSVRAELAGESAALQPSTQEVSK